MMAARGLAPSETCRIVRVERTIRVRYRRTFSSTCTDRTVARISANMAVSSSGSRAAVARSAASNPSSTLSSIRVSISSLGYPICILSVKRSTCASGSG
jgi:hypothetical protein